MVRDSDGIIYPITMARLPVKVLQPGWYPVGLQTGLKPYHLLELRNDDGPEHDAVWYLGDDLEFICNAAGSFLPEHGDLVAAHLSPLLRDIHQQSLCAPQSGMAASSRAFDGINPAFVRDLIGYVVSSALNPPEVVSLDPLERISATYAAGEVVLSVPLLRHALDMPAPNQVLDGLTLASPFDASLLYAQDQFVPEPGSGDEAITQAYRFHDPAAATTLYLLIRAAKPALFIPSINTVFATAGGLTGAQVLTVLLSYYASHGHHVEAAVPEPDPAAHPATDDEAPDDAATPYGIPQQDSEPWFDAPARSDAAVRTQTAEAPSTKWWKRLFGLGQP